jgi:hypothetical protein
MKEEGAISFPQKIFNRTLPEKFQSRSRSPLENMIRNKVIWWQIPAPFWRCLNCTIPCLHSPSQIHPPDNETMPVFRKTMPVRHRNRAIRGSTGLILEVLLGEGCP